VNTSIRSKAASKHSINYPSSRKESLDKALRACIENSVLTLIKRVDLSADAGV
jgi:hypothetical protein